jgi:hypothetical protein
VKDTNATARERRALAVVLATATDMQQQAELVTIFKRASALRGGRYLAAGKRVRLVGARVVRDASVSGVLASSKRAITGTLRLSGAGIAGGRLSVRLTTAGRGHATGTLDGRAVDLTFGFGS